MSDTCGTCYWFDHPWQAGHRHEVTCRALGSRPDDPACPFYGEDDQGVRPGAGEQTKARLRTLLNVGWDQVIREILAERYQAERDITLAVEDVATLFLQKQDDLVLDAEWLFRFTTFLLDLYVLKRLAYAFGLAEHAEEIVSLELRRRYGGLHDAKRTGQKEV